MTLVMSYVILIAAAIGAGTVAIEVVVERRRMPCRWLWVSSLAVTLVATALAMVLPVSGIVASESTAPTGSTLVLGAPATTPLVATNARVARDAAILTRADAVLPSLWFAASAGLLLAIALGRRALSRERIRAREVELVGQPVLLTDSIGPAVAGIRAPVVFIPTWVLALDEGSQRLLLAHEMEHVKRRDTAILFAGAVAVALVPWNPVVWWMVRRMRLAVEQDCDRRVLASHPGVRRYADLLLLAASRPGAMARLLAAHFGEHTSDLVRRIETMTRNSAISWRQLVSATAIASLLFAVACETPRPNPVAPIDLRNEAATPEPEVAFTEIEIERSRALIAQLKSQIEKYHALTSDMERLGAKIEKLANADSSFAELEKKVLPLKVTEVNVPEIRIGRDASDLVMGKVRPTPQDADTLVLYHRYDPNGASRVVPPNVIVFGSDGSETARFPSPGNAMAMISLHGVESIKKQETGNCAPLSCPLERITLKPGFRLLNYAEWKGRGK